MGHTLVIDQGTHASRAILFDAQGVLVEAQEQSITLQRINDEKVEQQADEIVDSIHHVIQRLDQQQLRQADKCAITTQRSTIVAWNKQSGKALHPVISWQDRRAADELNQFQNKKQQVTYITGLPLSPHYGANKMRWLLRHHPVIREACSENNLCIAPLASFLMFHLVKNRPYQVDHSNAHRTMLFDLDKLDWSDELLQLFEIPKAILPECSPMIHDYGRLVYHDIPVTAVCGDQSAAFYAEGNVAKGNVIINIGTGAFVMAPCNQQHRDTTLLSGIARTSAQHREYLLEGTVNGAGAALSWAQQQLPVKNLFQQLPHWLERYQHPPIFINNIGGLGSPWWKSDESPFFISAQQCSIAEKYSAIIESIVFLLQSNLDRMQQIIEIKQLNIAGGLSRLDGLCQKLSDLSQLPVHRMQETEATARGAAWLANNCPQPWSNNATNQRFQPHGNTAIRQRYEMFIAEVSRL